MAQSEEEKRIARERRQRNKKHKPKERAKSKKKKPGNTGIKKIIHKRKNK